MKIGLNVVSIALLLLTGMGSAFAGPFSHMRAGRDEARAARVQRGQPQQQGDPRRAPVAPGANTPAPAFPGGYGVPGRPGYGIRPADQPRVFGPRMSVEERQQRRRQINEAGQDIYAPRK